MDTKQNYTLEVFQGPLDLLLHLIEKNEIKITDIPIVTLLEQYMQYVESYKEAEIENLSEFLLVASKLIHIKSRMLLPHDDDEDPLEELVAMLVDYVRYKEIAMELGERYRSEGAKKLVKNPDSLSFPQELKKTYSPHLLVTTISGMFNISARKLPPPITAFSGIINKRVVSVGEKLIFILRNLCKKKRLSFNEIIGSSKDRSDIVASFMAVLELSRKERVVLTDIEGDMLIQLKGRKLETPTI